MPPGELASRLTAREFTRLHIDAASRPIGQRRIEILLAQLTFYVCSVWGGAKDVGIADYLKVLDPVEPEEEPDDDTPIDVDAQRAAFGFNPVNRKKDTDHVEQPGPPGGPARP